MLSEENFFRSNNKHSIWKRYCGFVDLSIDEFMTIQEQNLLEQIDLVWDTPLAKTIINSKPASIAEFRHAVPLTDYGNYGTYLEPRDEKVLAIKPCYWARTSGRDRSPKWVPFATKADEVTCRDMIGAWILATAGQKGEVNVYPGQRLLFNLPGRPYFSGWLAYRVSQCISFPTIPSLDISEKMDFKERVEKSFEEALYHDVDFLASLSSILIKVGEGFSDNARSTKLSLFFRHPTVLFRLITALIHSRLIERRALLPKDLWPVKAIFAWGTDTSIYLQQIVHYWGRTPYEIYGATEAGIIAMQSWTKNLLTFLADSVFLEFIPETEWLKNKKDTSYRPKTVLLNEVKAGEIYEIVLTSFYGMPFLRYRLGDLIKIVSLKDEEAGINLPQMLFHSRGDEIIDIAGFTRIGEKTVWQALANSGIKYEDWTVRKEYEQNNPVLRLYIELKESSDPVAVADAVHEQLKLLDNDYKDMDRMLGIKPLRVVLLSCGTFQHYLEEKRKSGLDLSHLKPPHVNSSDDHIRELLALSSKGQS